MLKTKETIKGLFLGVGLISISSLALASETITYAYDARGRLVQVAHSGSVNDGITADYTYDKADNRSNVTVSVASGAPPVFSIGDATTTEGGSLVFTISKGGTTSGSFSVNYASANGSASAGSDYSAVSGTLTFAPAEASKTISLSTIDDASVEGTETLTVNLSAATGGATISDAQGIGTITDNDAAPAVSFSVSDATGGEGGSLTFTVTKNGSTAISHSVSYATADGTALASSDYFSASGSLTFGSTETTKTVLIGTRNNSIVESNETFLLNLSAATAGATISDPQGVGTIIDDDDIGGGGCGPKPGQEPSCAPPEDPDASGP